MDERFVVDTEVARREDGILLTFHCSDGSVIEKYVSRIEAQGILDQIKRQLPTEPK